MKGTWAVCRFALTLLAKERSAYLVIVLAVAFVGLALVFGDTQIGAPHKLFEDTLLATQAFLLQGAALFYGFLLRSKEEALGLHVLPLAYGLSRGRYLLGMMLAPAALLGLVALGLAAADTVLIFLVEGSLRSAVLAQLLAYYLASMLLGMVFFTLSHYVSITNALLYTVVLVLVGNALDEVLIYVKTLQAPEALVAVKLLFYLLPNFSLYDFQSAVVNRRDIGWYTGLVFPLAYTLVWGALLYGVAWLRFVTKVLRGGR